MSRPQLNLGRFRIRVNELRRCDGAPSAAEPAIKEAGRVRHPPHRVEDDARMLGWPLGVVCAVKSFILLAQSLTLIPQSAGDVHAGAHPLEIDPQGHAPRRPPRGRESR